MSTIIEKTIFEEKPSLYTGRLALTTAGSDHTYGAIAGILANIEGYIGNHTGGIPVRKVLVRHTRHTDALLILLALMKRKVEVILVDMELTNEAVRNILEAESPDLVITEKDSGIRHLYACLPLHVDEIDGYHAETGSCSGEDIRAAVKLGIYSTGYPSGQWLDQDALAGKFAEMERMIAPIARDKYLIAGEIPFPSFLVEGLWCLLNGIHLLCYPYDDTVIAALLPDEQRFPMDFTLFFFGSAKDEPGHEDCYELLMNCVRHADEHNYAGIWTPERHFNEFGGKYPNPSVLSAAIAAVTSRVQIRTGSIVSPLHHVVRIAEDWSVIDNISGGRTALSFASGWQCNDFVFYPGNYADRHGKMFEQIRQFRELWAGGKLELDNGAGDKIQVGIYPRPIQKEMPVWVTVSGRIETFIDAGKIGANILTHLLWQEPVDLIEKIQAYRDSLKENGYEPHSRIVSVMLHTYVGKTRAEVRKAVEKPLKAYIRSSLHLIEAMASTVKATKGVNAIGRYGKNDEQMTEEMKEELLEFAFERFLSSTSLLGDQAHCMDVLKTLRSYGVDELACLIDFGLDNTTILKGLDELKELKDQYRPPRQKKYDGNFILRTSNDTLLQLMESRPEDIDRCRLLVTEKEPDEPAAAYDGPEAFLHSLTNPIKSFTL